MAETRRKRAPKAKPEPTVVKESPVENVTPPTQTDPAGEQKGGPSPLQEEIERVPAGGSGAESLTPATEPNPDGHQEGDQHPEAPPAPPQDEAERQTAALAQAAQENTAQGDEEVKAAAEAERLAGPGQAAAPDGSILVHKHVLPIADAGVVVVDAVAAAAEPIPEPPADTVEHGGHQFSGTYAKLMKILQREEGATHEEMVAETGWESVLPTVGAWGELGVEITSELDEKRGGRVYRVT